jgi:glutamyl-tRNA reductase
MSGPAVGEALRERFESIRRAELLRLNKKLRGLTDEQRESVEAITADITRAIVGVAERGLSEHGSQPAVDAIIRLFRL